MSLAALLGKVPKELVAVVADVVTAILEAPDKRLAARRAQEAARRSVLDAAAKRAKPRK